MTSARASVTVRVTFDSLCTLSRRLVGGDTGLGTSLCAMLDAGRLDAYRNHVAAQSGKALTSEEAATLSRLAEALAR